MASTISPAIPLAALPPTPATPALTASAVPPVSSTANAAQTNAIPATQASTWGQTASKWRRLYRSIEIWVLYVTVMSLVIALLGLPYMLESTRDAHNSLALARWTAGKDYREYCSMMNETTPHSLTAECFQALTTLLPAPPLRTRFLEYFTTNPALATLSLSELESLSFASVCLGLVVMLTGLAARISIFVSRQELLLSFDGFLLSNNDIGPQPTTSNGLNVEVPINIPRQGLYSSSVSKDHMITSQLRNRFKSSWIHQDEDESHELWETAGHPMHPNIGMRSDDTNFHSDLIPEGEDDDPVDQEWGRLIKQMDFSKREVAALLNSTPTPRKVYGKLLSGQMPQGNGFFFLERGTRVEILPSTMTKTTWVVQSLDGGRVGLVPRDAVEVFEIVPVSPSFTKSTLHDHGNTTSRSASPEVTTKKITHVRALFDFQPTEPGELEFRKGDVIEVLESVYKGWWKGSLRGQIGIFPLNYVDRLPDNMLAILLHNRASTRAESCDNGSHGDINTSIVNGEGSDTRQPHPSPPRPPKQSAAQRSKAWSSIIRRIVGAKKDSR